MSLSMPLLWVVLPFVVAAASFAFLNKRILGIVITAITAFGLSLLAILFPEDLTLSIGPLQLVFTESLAILGRQISIDYEILPFIAFIFAVTGLWSLNSGTPSIPEIFRPISLMITALLTAAMGVEPFLYAALFIQAAVLVSVPILSPVTKKTNPGILRYLTLQTLALPLILLAGWLLTGVETLPPDSPKVAQTTIVLGLGFALWLGIFPFHTWVPMVGEDSQPAIMIYLMTLFPTTILTFSLNFFDRYTFLRTSENLYVILGTMGALMVIFGGVWTMFQDNLKRAFGFAALAETGFSLLALSLLPQGGARWMLMLFPVRALGFWLWGYALTQIEKYADSLTISSVIGLARRYPLLSSGLILAQLSIAGLPILAAFPIKINLLTAVAGTNQTIGTLAFIGNLGLFLFTLRLAANLVSPKNKDVSHRWSISEKRFEYIPLLIVILLLVILGLFPHTIFAKITDTLTAFTQLQ
jgi:NADH:ubiquinone oxidoreductase subunit 2 (subunit N)